MTVFVDYAHFIQDDYFRTILCEVGSDSVDLVLLKQVQANDLVITQDYGLASLVLSKGAKVLHISGKVIDDNNYIFLTDKSIILKGNRGETISFQAYCDEVKNFNISGAKYNLTNFDLKLGDSITTSNEFLDEEIEITFDSGIVMILYTND